MDAELLQADRSLPTRVQLSRRKGWRLPANTVNVARPGRWGNPFPIGRPGPQGKVAVDQASSVRLFRSLLADQELRTSIGYPNDLTPLRGKSLACWCQLGTPCHADVLLELASEGVG